VRGLDDDSDFPRAAVAIVGTWGPTSFVRGGTASVPRLARLEREWPAGHGGRLCGVRIRFAAMTSHVNVRPRDALASGCSVEET
jgi:hypothetical protein